MQDFYRRRQDDQLTTVGALRQAQLSFIHGTRNLPEANESTATRGTFAVPDSEDGAAATEAATYANPYYWAPFVLMGNIL
jgi:CHAT domain-containing protein